jgi:zinc protease
MNIDQIKSKNNLNTLFVDSPGSTAATVQIWFRAGSALESKKDEGIAHFLEHMFFKGTKKRPGAKIAHEVESFGGEVNAFTSFDYTCYYINTPNNHLNSTVEILLDMVSNPEFLQKELEPEREVVFEEYRRSQDNASQFNFQQLQNAAFTKGYKHPILGNEKTIKNFSREQLISFRNANYNLENSMLIVAGDLKNRTQIESIINKFKMPSGKKSIFPRFELQNKTAINVHHKDVRQNVLTMAIQGPKYNEATTADEDLAINCFAHGEMSPLYQGMVIDQPIASGTSGSTMYFSKGGVHFLRVVFPTENTDLVLNKLQQVISSFSKTEIDKDAIDKIKKQYIASKVYEKESLEAFAFSLGHGFAQDGNIKCEEEFINRIKKSQSTNINTGIKNIFNREIHYTLQVPKSESIAENKKKIKAFDTKIKQAFKNAKISDSKLKFETSPNDPEVKVLEIKKGIKLIYRQNAITPTFVFHAYLKGGMSAETEHNCGAHYLLSRLFTYGYKKVPYDTLKNELENFSANLNGFSGKNAYGMTMHGQSENFNSLVDHFFGSFIEPQLPSKFISLEKSLVERTIENQKEDPVKHCFKTFNDYVFNDHHYAQDLIGTLKSIKKHSKKSLLELHSKHMNSSEIVFTYCGDLELDDVLIEITKKIEHLKPRKFNKTKIKKAKSILGKRDKILFDREQSHIFIGTKAYNINQTEDLYLKMVTAHLNGQSSELFVDVRDRQGLCYSVQPVHHAALEAGYWGIYIAAGHDKVDKAIAAIEKILKKIATKGLTKAEFNRIKKMLDGQTLLNIQTNDDYANIYSIPVLHSLGIDYSHDCNKKIREIKHEDFCNFTTKFFKSKMNIIEVGR